MKRNINKENYGILFILPFFIAYLIFGIYPIVYSFILSLNKWDGMSMTKQFVGLKNYSRLLKDPIFLKSIGNTWIIWGCAVVPQMVFALLLAVILNDPKFKGANFFRAVYYLPNLVTATSIATLFFFLFDWKYGQVNMIFINLHIFKEPYNWMSNAGSARGVISLIQWWMWFGYSMIIFMAGLKNIPEELYEAATVDGANKWQVFWKVTLPLLRPTILFSTLTSLIGGMQLFDIPWVISGGQGTPANSTVTMVMYLYNTAFTNNNYGYGAAVGYGLFVIILVFSVIAFKLVNRNADYE